jgi:chromosome segregation ATPase
LENARAEKLEAARKEIKAAEIEINTLKNSRFNVEKQIENLRAEAEKIKTQNEATQAAAKISHNLELEKMTSDKLAEAEKICQSRISAATERVKQIEAEAAEKEEKLAAEIAASTEALVELRRMNTAQKLQAEQERDEQMIEIEKFLDNYKAERLSGIQEDIARQSKILYKQVKAPNEE